MDLPQAFIDKYQDLLGSASGPFLQALQEPGQKGFRINPLKAQQTPRDLSLTKKVPYGQWGYFGQVAGKGIDHLTGLVYSQEPSAQFVGEVVNAKPGEKILDLAAAPGGKSTHIASQLNGQGLLWTNEIFFARAKILSENIERFGVKNAIVSSMDASDLAKALPAYFDKVLLDAPCSGEGMFRKDHDAIQYWSAYYPTECAMRSHEILESAVKLVRPGGELIYSTCTFAPEEDEQTIAWLVKHYPEFTIEAIDRPAGSGIQAGRPEWADGNPDLARTARLWPQDLPGEGHFVARLKKAELAEDERPVKAPKAQKPSKMSQADVTLMEHFFQESLPGFDLDESRLRTFGDRVFLLPVDCPDLSKTKVLRAGLCLGTLKKNRFEPDHALALAVNPSQAGKQVYDLDAHDDLATYIHGDVINTKDDLQKGFVLMTANGNGLGWAKFVNGQLKNFFPKGLRY
ncbi:RsmF rRNA methyltransferase first C-terminal domain-containing protein [Fructobacillus tropaeoli]|uniref:NOL1/NOP2/FMU family (Ncl1) n=1 Tax=Fructobacillus tropaeoli TaxID=709323 RepID=A0A3F3HCZ1_9LACO|nr:RsmF rRNA methyltransferase first C-terminal domain-containing protein [Fructobacillus tropaeoli]GAP03673.1 tRNA and rRNA cytosine-C5-methylases [Fructobacillus tropaeoli]GIC70010.1 RNA methyltransferase [Fructobacillus tropaeoli]CAK1227844.1 NOL1/NOP2/FMU family (Ncl1) [Fructobacillus tropaeoli]